MQASLRPLSSLRPAALTPCYVGRPSTQKRILSPPARNLGQTTQLLAFSHRASVAAATAAPHIHIATPPSAVEQQQQQRNWLASAAAFIARSALLVGLVIAVTLTTAGNAFAARTGGRAGGSSFGARSSYGGGGGGSSFGGSGFASRSTPSAARSTSHSSHTTVIHSGPSWGMSSLFIPVTPFGYGVGHTQSGGGSIIVTMLMIGVLSYIAIKAFQMMGTSGTSDEDGEGEPSVTVAKVQVGLLAVAQDIKADLNMLAATANTSTPEGLHLLLQETVVALLRNPAYCTYGASSSKVVEDARSAESLFNTMTMEERSKVDSETLVNVSGMRRTKSVAISANSPAELIVVNLMIAAEGDLQLPAIRSITDLKLALSKLASVPARDLMAVEVFWTPQADEDVLTQQDCLVMYPSLAPL